ncbi:radical S-adenosyl methionine domain-containing protein 1, mitochondrial-like isoform X2 [Lineus longissimus]|uniref:radical S-adenosyl methionine domain-containing protein 1, mitochondrial-like isoform X2 n=1 Tax=Lineus longissimus TaxID=88925 RepID=UPI00315D0146
MPMWPYCEKRCTYCNFNKYISKQVDHEQMKRCLGKEIQSLIYLSGIKEITSIFFGGGTPSLAEPSTLGHVIETVAKEATLADSAEITMEANPTSVEATKLREFKAAGINRLSLGIQALNDRDLKILGREHTVQEALSCLSKAKSLFPGKTSLDLIFGRPFQTLELWQDELHKTANLLADGHVSLYQLTLERGTALFKSVQNGELTVPDTDVTAEMYEMAVQTLKKSGLKRYEASNFARNASAESSHNKSYWEGSQYIGVGPGAHGRFIVQSEGGTAREARIQTLEPKYWMWEVEKRGHATRKAVEQTRQEVMEEILMLGMRTKSGVPNKRWLRFSDDVPLAKIFGGHPMLSDFIQFGLLEFSPERLVATERGLNLIDSLMPTIINILHDYNWKSPRKELSDCMDSKEKIDTG